jgi:hypothetical protein
MGDGAAHALAGAIAVLSIAKQGKQEKANHFKPRVIELFDDFDDADHEGT